MANIAIFSNMDQCRCRAHAYLSDHGKSATVCVDMTDGAGALTSLYLSANQAEALLEELGRELKLARDLLSRQESELKTE